MSRRSDLEWQAHRPFVGLPFELAIVDERLNPQTIARGVFDPLTCSAASSLATPIRVDTLKRSGSSANMIRDVFGVRTTAMTAAVDAAGDSTNSLPAAGHLARTN